jgi:hypothetical protein
LLFEKDPAASPRALSVEPLLGRRDEWAGVDVYVPEQDALWIGVEVKGSRDFVRIDLADVDKRVKPLESQRAASD